MTDDTIEKPLGRTTRQSENRILVEQPIVYTDGFRVTVGWSEADKTWYASTNPEKAVVLGHGNTKEEALCCLVCAMAATIDSMEP